MSELKLKNLRKVYADFTLTLDLEVREGEFLTLVGPSGSGKSTVLNLIAGLETPDEGQILLGEKDITKVPSQKRNVGLVFQDYALFSNMNVEKNLAYAMKLKKVKSKERSQRVESLLSFVNLPDYGKRKVTTLSGGEAQRVALARALSAEPEVLLLDEPLSALDAALRRRMKDEIRRIHDENPGLTTVYVTHDREEAFSISDRIAIMMDGKLQMVDTPEMVYRKPATLQVATFTGEGTSLSSSLFDIECDADAIFFRPESATIKEGVFYGDYEAYLILENAEIIGAEFLGSRYLLGLTWEGHPIIAESITCPRSRIVTLYIRKTQLLFFKDGKLVE